MESVEGQPTCAHALRRRVSVRRNRAASALLIAGVIASAAGCASGASGSSSPSTGTTLGSSGAPSASGSAPSTGTASSSASASVDQNSPQSQAAIATYRAMWADVVKVQTTMNDRDPTLALHVTGGALFYFQQAIHINKLNGYVAKGEPTLLHPTVKQVVGSGDAAKVLIEDCVDQAPFRLFTSDGTPVSTTPDGRHMTQALVERQADGTLKVTTFVFNKVATC